MNNEKILAEVEERLNLLNYVLRIFVVSIVTIIIMIALRRKYMQLEECLASY